MTGPADEWRALCDAFARFSRRINQARTVNINASSLRKEAKDAAQQYFRQTRPLLQDLALDEQLEVLDAGFQNLIELSERNNAKTSYKKHTANIRKLMPKVTSRIELTQGIVKTELNATAEDERIIQTLERLVPSAALSYKQSIIDLADDTRISFRGPALELREALRETLDHLAPDDEVMAADGYVQEKGRNGPTMKQKVRFVLKARGKSKASTSVPEQTTMTVDEMVGTLARSVHRGGWVRPLAQQLQGGRAGGDCDPHPPRRETARQSDKRESTVK